MASPSAYEVSFADDTKSRAIAINARLVLALEQASGPTPRTLPVANEPITAQMNPTAEPAIRTQATYRIDWTPFREVVPPHELRFSTRSEGWRRPCRRWH